MTETKTHLALIKASELSLIEDNALNAAQLKLILKKTPPQYIKKRPAKGGGQWSYVTGGYVKKCLNLMFGFDWDFEILLHEVIGSQVIVKGKLTCRAKGKTIIKMQFGGKDIAFKTEYIDGKRTPTDKPLDLANDLKAASTDCLKKCASEIGIAADIYNAEDFKEVLVAPPIDKTELFELLALKKESMTPQEIKHANRILDNDEEHSYEKLNSLLQSK